MSGRMSRRMSDHLCYLRDSSEYIHGTVATPPPDLCGTWKVPAWSPDNVSGGRDSMVVSGFRDRCNDVAPPRLWMHISTS